MGGDRYEKVFKYYLLCLFPLCRYSAVFADEPVYKEYTVTVAEGETLWEIAGRHTEAREDVREVIFRIEQANKLNSKHIYPGQVLRVPLRVHDNGLMVAER